MRLQTVPPEEAVGHILRHNLPDEQGRKALSKGHVIAETDLPRLHMLGIEALRVAILEPGDVPENEAAQRLARAVAGAGVHSTEAHAGRVNLLAVYPGPLTVDVVTLTAINSLEGLTVATLPEHTLVQERQVLATIKIIPFAVPETVLAQVEARGQSAQRVIEVRPLHVLQVGVVLVGSARAQKRIEAGVYPAIEARVAALGAAVVALRYVLPDEQAVAEAVSEMLTGGIGLFIVAVETSIMDRDDVTPVGIRLAGGLIEHYGAPVEPGNLLLLAYLTSGLDNAQAIPVLGAPGCVRSRDTNIVDLLLPRLLAGEHVRRSDIVELGHGGLLQKQRGERGI